MTHLDAALDYASRFGWPVFPVHGIRADGCCTCGDTDCRSPGKHPVQQDGAAAATTDSAAISTIWAEHPDANIGVPAGSASGVDVLDIDPRHGGTDSLAKMVDEFQALPDTVASLTGGGGRHYLFRHEEGVRSRIGMHPGVDVRGEGGSFIVPPSRHHTGGGYAWDSSLALDAVAAWPSWLAATITRKGRSRMALNKEITSLDDVAEKYRPLYSEKDGAYVLDEELLFNDDNPQIEEFRNTNRDLYTRNQALDADIQKLQATVEAMNKQTSAVEEEKQTNAQRIEALEAANREKDEALQRATAENRRSSLRDLIKSAGASGGVRKNALDDFADMALPQWEADDSGQASRIVNGTTVLSTDRAGQPQSIEEFVVEMGQQKAFFFDSSGGDGAEGGGAGRNSIRIIPNDPATIGKNAEAIAKGEVEVEGFTSNPA